MQRILSQPGSCSLTSPHHHITTSPRITNHTAPVLACCFLWLIKELFPTRHLQETVFFPNNNKALLDLFKSTTKQPTRLDLIGTLPWRKLVNSIFLLIILTKFIFPLIILKPIPSAPSYLRHPILFPNQGGEQAPSNTLVATREKPRSTTTRSSPSPFYPWVRRDAPQKTCDTREIIAISRTRNCQIWRCRPG